MQVGSYPYTSRLLHWHWGNRMIAPVPVKRPWRVWAYNSHMYTQGNIIHTMTSSNGNIFHVTGHCATRGFNVFFDQRPNKRLSRQWWGCWFETPPLWRHNNEPQQNKIQPNRVHLLWKILYICINLCILTPELKEVKYHNMQMHPFPICVVQTLDGKKCPRNICWIYLFS